MNPVKSAAILALAWLPCLAAAKPCDGVTRSAPGEDNALPAISTAQLHTASAKVREVFGVRDWHILHVQPIDLEPAYLFYQGDPATSQYKDLWAGSARLDEQADIRKWVLHTFPGIPARLAKCFAWTVTAGQKD